MWLPCMGRIYNAIKQSLDISRLHAGLQDSLRYGGYRAEVDGAGDGQVSAQRDPPVSAHTESEELVVTIHHVEDLTRGSFGKHLLVQ